MENVLIVDKDTMIIFVLLKCNLDKKVNRDLIKEGNVNLIEQLYIIHNIH